MARYQREICVALAYVVLLGVLAAAAPSFYQGQQLRTLVVSASPVLVAAVGMTLVILARQIDISIGSQLSICGVAAGLLAKTGLPMPLVIVGVMLIGAGLGAVNGLFVALLELPSIVVTLATMVIYRESLLWWRQGRICKKTCRTIFSGSGKDKPSGRRSSLAFPWQCLGCLPGVCATWPQVGQSMPRVQTQPPRFWSVLGRAVWFLLCSSSWAR